MMNNVYDHESFNVFHPLFISEDFHMLKVTCTQNLLNIVINEIAFISAIKMEPWLRFLTIIVSIISTKGRVTQKLLKLCH